MSEYESTCGSLEIFRDAEWHVPVKVNDQRAKQGWIGYRLSDGRIGVAVPGEWRKPEVTQ